jgi:hypothetical protein
VVVARRNQDGTMTSASIARWKVRRAMTEDGPTRLEER